MKDPFDTKPKIKKKLNPLPENPELDSPYQAVKSGRFPSWLHRPLPKGANLFKTNSLLNEKRLHTVCEEAKCPNLLECFSKKTATFLVLGKDCTRSCGFCDIDHLKSPPPPDPEEPKNLALTALKLGLKHIVITMVARDDLEDGGAAHLVKILDEINTLSPTCTTEMLTSDFEGKKPSLDILLNNPLDIFNHNIETVEELTPRVRHKATYKRTLSVLSYAKSKARKTKIKSGIMVGLGETKAQVFTTLKDLKDVGCDIVTIGQYLQPNRKKLRVKSFITPQEFKEYEEYGHSIGISFVYSGPFVRSSYNADLVQRKINQHP